MVPWHFQMELICCGVEPSLLPAKFCDPMFLIPPTPRRINYRWPVPGGVRSEPEC